MIQNTLKGNQYRIHAMYKKIICQFPTWTKTKEKEKEIEQEWKIYVRMNFTKLQKRWKP